MSAGRGSVSSSGVRGGRRVTRYRLRLERVVPGGKMLGHLPNGKVVLVEGGYPGEEVVVRVQRERRDYIEAVVEEVVRAHPRRQKAFCPHFGVCGGCAWQDIPYSVQLELKRAIVEDAFVQVGGFTGLAIPHVLPSPVTEGFRNKMEFSIGDVRGEPVLGLHPRGSWERVLPLEVCRIIPVEMEEVRSAFAEFLRRHRIPGYNPHYHRGLARTLLLRITKEKALMVVLVLTRRDESVIQLMKQELYPGLRHVVSWYTAVNPKRNESLSQGVTFFHLWGERYIEERVLGLRFRIGPRSFFQTNLYQVDRLFDRVLEIAQPEPTDTVLDLYCGTGTFTLLFAPHVRRVAGVEIVQEAVERARENAQLNNLPNAVFYAGDVKRVLPRLIREGWRPTLVVTDPARSGMTRSVLQVLCQVRPSRIVYVSCNPVTQARDCAYLVHEGGYTIQTIQPIDMFPHTPHVENIVLLRASSSSLVA